MKYMLIIASIAVLAVASPPRSLVDPDVAGPVPAPAPEPIAIGPVIIGGEPIAVIPAPAPVLPVEDITAPVVPTPVLPLVQIILNINGHQISVPGIVEPGTPVDVAPEPVHVVENPPEPVDITLPIIPEPVQIGTPEVPVMPEVMPDELN